MAFNGLASRAAIGMFFEALSQDVGGDTVRLLGGEPFTSDQASEDYPWIGQVPQLREWKGGRQAKSFNDQSINIKNVHYESTIDVPLTWLRRDKTGQIRQRIGELARRAQAHWLQLLMAKLVVGESTTCYDGQFFFDTDHSEADSGTQDNDITVDISAVPGSEGGTTTDPGVVEIRACIMEAVTQMLAFKDDRGEFVNEMSRNFLVVVPTTLFVAAARAVGQQFVGGGNSNFLAEGVLDGYRFRVATSPRLNATWTDRFPVFCTDGTQKPFILQEESPLMLKVKDENSEYAFDNDAVQYGVDTWRAVDFGDWKKSCLVTMT